jgi:competence protein ComEC
MPTDWLTMQWTKAPSGAFVFYTVSLSFLAGVFLYSFFNFGLSAPVGLLTLGILALAVLITLKSPRSFVFLLILVALALGMVRMLMVPDVQAPFVAYDKEKVVVVGSVDADPDKRDTSIHVAIAVQSINGEDATGLLQATVDRTTAISYGDTVSLSGKLALPQAFKTQTGKDFDYPEYLRAKGIGAVMVYPTLVVTEHAHISFFGMLYTIKHALEHAIEISIPEPAAGLLEGILLGNRTALGDALYTIFIIAGLVHVVVLSGYNLTIVADALMKLCSRFPQKISLAIGSTGIILFGLAVGAEATVVRACIMALIVVVGRVLKRPNEIMRTLLFACVVMVIHNPLILTADPSFILSFLAAFGLITFAPAFEKRLSLITAQYGIRGVVSATLATQAFVFPALIFYTGRLSLMALPSNLLALPLIPFAMFFGFITGVLGLIHPWLALPAMIPAWALLSVIILIAKLAASIPGAALTVGGLQTPYIFALYIILAPLAIHAYAKAKEYTP